MPDRPNILLLHTDQQRYDSIAALGATHAITPNMDRLVNHGLTFTNAYTSSPFCMPARHDLLTGTSALRHGYYQNHALPIQDYGLATLPRLLTAAGYHTAAVGKMHFYPEREHHGFSHMYLMEELPDSWENDAYVQYLLELGYDVRCQHGVRPVLYPVPQVARVPEEHHGSAWVAHKTIELLKAERDQPFFIWASWVGPHPPFYVPQDYLDLYEGAVFPPSHLTPEQADEVEVPPEIDVSLPWVQRFKEGYFARVTLIDKHLGRILDALEETGQLEDTLVIFTSDHGELLGDRRLFSKTVAYQGSTHIPTVLYGRGIEADTRAITAANTWDVAATILCAAGVEPPDDHPLIGSDLRSLDPRDTDRVVISHCFENERRWIAAMTARYKLVHHYRDGSQELYDLLQDPWEEHNQVADPDLMEVASRLSAACTSFELDHGKADGVRGDRLGTIEPAPPIDHPDAMIRRHTTPWPFNWMQFPRWMTSTTQGDRDAILREMWDVVTTRPDILLPEEDAWRQQVIASWQALGGRAEEMISLFDATDARACDR